MMRTPAGVAFQAAYDRLIEGRRLALDGPRRRLRRPGRARQERAGAGRRRLRLRSLTTPRLAAVRARGGGPAGALLRAGGRARDGAPATKICGGDGGGPGCGVRPARDGVRRDARRAGAAGPDDVARALAGIVDDPDAFRAAGAARSGDDALL